GMRRPSVAVRLRSLVVLDNLRIVTADADEVRQRIEPDVGHDILVERELDPPIEPRFRARDAEIAAEFLDGVSQFRLPKIWNNSVLSRACGVDVRQQPLLVSAQFEVIIFFFAKLELAPLRSEFAIWTAFFVGKKLFLSNAVVAGLFVLVDLAFIEQALQHSLHDFLVN